MRTISRLLTWNSAVAIALVLTVAGAILVFCIAKPLLDKGQASRDWPKTKGRVLSSAVAEKGINKVRYRAEVAYAYMVGGREYRGCTVFFGDNWYSASPNEAVAAVARYRVGRQVDVYYDPSSKETAVLEPGIPTSCYWFAALGGVFLVAGVCFAAIGIRGNS